MGMALLKRHRDPHVDAEFRNIYQGLRILGQRKGQPGPAGPPGDPGEPGVDGTTGIATILHPINIKVVCAASGTWQSGYFNVGWIPGCYVMVATSLRIIYRTVRTAPLRAVLFALKAEGRRMHPNIDPAVVTDPPNYYLYETFAEWSWTTDAITLAGAPRIVNSEEGDHLRLHIRWNTDGTGTYHYKGLLEIRYIPTDLIAFGPGTLLEG